MFKFVVLVAIVAVAVAAPAPSGFELASPLALSADPWGLSSLGLQSNPWLSSAPLLRSDPWLQSGSLLQSAPLLQAGPSWSTHSAPLVHSSPIALQAAPLVSQPIIQKQIYTSEPVVSTVVKPAVTGAIVQNVPTAVSHQSQSIVHHDNIVTPVITPVEKQYISHAPVIKTIAEPAPLAISHGWNAPLLSSW